MSRSRSQILAWLRSIAKQIERLPEIEVFIDSSKLDSDNERQGDSPAMRKSLPLSVPELLRARFTPPPLSPFSHTSFLRRRARR